MTADYAGEWTSPETGPVIELVGDSGDLEMCIRKIQLSKE